MNNLNNTSGEGTQNGASEMQQGKTFTQEDVNRIVQERLAKEKGKGNDELDKRAAELDKRERRMNAVDELRKNGLPDYLVDALNMETDETFQQSMEAIKKMKGETIKSSDSDLQEIIGSGNPIGVIKKGGANNDMRAVFGLD
jgi:hypothetical protein